MKVFLIQSSEQNFKNKLAQDICVPVSVFKTDNQIMISEHYFQNILRKYFPEKDIKETIELFYTDTEEKWNLFDLIFEKTTYEIFEYEVI